MKDKIKIIRSDYSANTDYIRQALNDAYAKGYKIIAATTIGGHYPYIEYILELQESAETTYIPNRVVGHLTDVSLEDKLIAGRNVARGDR